MTPVLDPLLHGWPVSIPAPWASAILIGEERARRSPPREGCAAKPRNPSRRGAKATPRPSRPPRVGKPLSLGVKEELRLATADLIRIRAEREQLRLELSALKAHCHATGVGKPRIPNHPLVALVMVRRVSFWFFSTQYGRIMGAVCRHSDQGRPL